MNIIIIAYSFSPFGGSEEAIGWNISSELSKYNNVIVYTKKEHETDISRYLEINPNKNLLVKYIDIPNIYKMVYKGPFYSGRLNIFLKKVKKDIEKNVSYKKIDIIHQVNPVEFRSICYLKNKGKAKYVVGPIGGGEYIPKNLKKYLSVKDNFLEFIRKTLNGWFKIKYKFLKYSKYIDKIYSANVETANYLNDCFNNIEIKTEIGIKEFNNRKVINDNDNFTLLVVGRLVYRKGHKLLLDAVAKIDKNKKFKLVIVGNGPMKEELEKYANSLNINDRVTFVGDIPYNEVGVYYSNCNAFILPSLRETTGTVVLEALSYGIPLITSNKYGASIICNEFNSLSYDLNNSKTKIINELSELIIKIIDKEIVFDSQKIINSIQKYNWDIKAREYYNMYLDLINK